MPLLRYAAAIGAALFMIACTTVKSTKDKNDNTADSGSDTDVHGTVLGKKWKLSTGVAAVTGGTGLTISLTYADPDNYAFVCFEDGSQGTSESGTGTHADVVINVDSKVGVYQKKGFSQDVAISESRSIDDYTLEVVESYKIEIEKITATRVTGTVHEITGEKDTSLAGPFSVEICKAK